VEMPSTVGTLHSKFQLNRARRFRDMAFKNWLSFLVSFLLFSSWYESYHKVETGYLIALKFGTQKGGVRAHLSTRFAYDKHWKNYLRLFAKNNTNMLSRPHVG